MSDTNVLVVFYSRFGKTERLALAFGVGAIQARGSLRLRRVADLASQEVIDASAAWRENLDRMNGDYVVPRPADPAWADVIVLAAPADATAEVEGFCGWLQSLETKAGRIAVPVVPGASQSALRSLYAAAASAGMIVVPQTIDGDDVGAAREYGRRITELARTFKGLHADSAASGSGS
jgi:hypothetical protein